MCGELVRPSRRSRSPPTLSASTKAITIKCNSGGGSDDDFRLALWAENGGNNPKTPAISGGAGDFCGLPLACGSAWQEGRTPPLPCPRPNRTKSVPNRSKNTAFSAYSLYKTSLESMAGGVMVSV
jgi:hypothetical protein